MTNIESYREKVFNLISGLKYLDGFDKDEKEAEDSEIDDDDANEEGNDDGNDLDGEGDSDDDDEDVVEDEDDDEHDDDADDEEAEDEDEVGLNYLEKEEIDVSSVIALMIIRYKIFFLIDFTGGK